jgi:hypothetical protein
MISKADGILLSAPDTKAGRLQRACLELLREHQRNGAIPTNGRFLFYELEQRGVIPANSTNGTSQPGSTRPSNAKRWGVRLIRQHLDSLLPQPIEVIHEREEKQRTAMLAALRKLAKQGA